MIAGRLAMQSFSLIARASSLGCQSKWKVVPSLTDSEPNQRCSAFNVSGTWPVVDRAFNAFKRLRSTSDKNDSGRGPHCLISISDMILLPASGCSTKQMAVSVAYAPANLMRKMEFDMMSSSTCFSKVVTWDCRLRR